MFIVIKTVIKATEYASVVKAQYNEHIDILEITHPNCQASISLYAGHVLHWQPTGEKPVLWLSQSAQFSKGAAIRGGIPICWPWFGPKLNTENDNVGNHGFARTSQWHIEHIDITLETVEVTLSFTGQDMHEYWPYPFELIQTLVFSTELFQSLSYTNNTGANVEVGHALHTYFSVSSPSAVRIANLDGVSFDDKVTGYNGQKDVLEHCVGQIDRIYYDNNEQVIQDNGWQREIIVNTESCHNWVLWNPGKEIAGAMSDIHENGENEFVCLEAANAMPHTLSAGETQRVAQRIQVRAMPL